MSNPPAPLTAEETHPEPIPLENSSERPTRVRYGVLAFLGGMAFVLYLDRACIGQAAPLIKADLGISETQKGIVFAAFTLAYAVFEVPTGRWGDRYGSRGVLTRIVVWWSFFTALTGAATGFWMLLLVRFLFGAGEAGALPNSARVLRAWFHESSRGRAQGFVTAAMLIGAAVAPKASQLLIDQVGWRWSFVGFGVIGLVWAGAFYVWFRDDPGEHTATNEAERRLIAGARKSREPLLIDAETLAPDLVSDESQAHGPIPWDRVLPCANVWLLGAVMMTMSAFYYMLFSWYPTYLQEARGVSQDRSSDLSTLVLGAGAFGTLFGGWLTDWLVQKTGNRRWGRTGQAVVGAGLAAVGVVGSVLADSAVRSSAFVALACFGIELQLPSWWACATQVSGRHLGALFGLMNMIGGVGAIVSQVFFGIFADWRKGLGYSGRAQWDPAWYAYAVVALIGMILWSLINPEKTVEGPKAKSAGLDASRARSHGASS
jgi:MFS family permease